MPASVAAFRSAAIAVLAALLTVPAALAGAARR
jgi:hypothetical protein